MLSSSLGGDIYGHSHLPHPIHTYSAQCINCHRREYADIAHAASDTSCPVYLEHKRRKVIMAKFGLSPRDALQFLSSHGSRLTDDRFDTRPSSSSFSVTSFGDYLPPHKYSSAVSSSSAALSTNVRNTVLNTHSNFPKLKFSFRSSSSSSSSSCSLPFFRHYFFPSSVFAFI